MGVLGKFKGKKGAESLYIVIQIAHGLRRWKKQKSCMVQRSTGGVSGKIKFFIE